MFTAEHSSHISLVYNNNTSVRQDPVRYTDGEHGEDEELWQRSPGEYLEEPDSLMLLNLIKDEIVNGLHLP